MSSHEFVAVADNEQYDTIGSEQADTGYLSVKISDFIMSYIGDSLKWLKAKNLNGASINGINYNGITIFENDSVSQLIVIMSVWKQLFDQAPQSFELLSMADKNQLENVIVEKTVIVEAFDNLIGILKFAHENDRMVVHYGV